MSKEKPQPGEWHGVATSLEPPPREFASRETCNGTRCCADHPTRQRLGWGIVRNAGRCSSERKCRWAHVRDVTGLGSSSATALCREFGVDPYDLVGGSE